MYGMERKPKRKSQSKLMISYAGAYHMSDLLLVATFLWGLFLNFPNFISFSFFFKNLHHEKKANLDERRGGDSQGWTSNLGPFFFFFFSCLIVSFLENNAPWKAKPRGVW